MTSSHPIASGSRDSPPPSTAGLSDRFRSCYTAVAAAASRRVRSLRNGASIANRALTSGSGIMIYRLQAHERRQARPPGSLE